MNGRDLALGLIGALALAGAVRKRGSRAMLRPETLPSDVHVQVNIDRHDLRTFVEIYALRGEDLVGLFRMERGFRPRNPTLFEVSETEARLDGLGPLLYDLGLEVAHRLGAQGVVPDQSEISTEAARVWKHYYEQRPDVTSTPLPRGFLDEEEEEERRFNEDPRQGRVYTSGPYGEALARVYSKTNTSVMDGLVRRGLLETGLARGSATRTTPVKMVPVERFWTIPDKLEETLQDVAEGRRSYSYDAPLRVSALDTPRGHYFVLDGHHRLVEHLQAGDRTVAIELDPYTPRIERTGGAHRNMVARKVNIAARVRRGSASLEAWPNADALARTFTDTMANATAQQMGRWAKKNGLVYIGSGQSRAVFAEPDGGRVLKLVFSFFGREANRDEARAWREASPAMRPHLVPVLAVDPMGNWLVMERVKPMRATQHIPKQTMDALKGCGFLDLRRPNFAADGRLLDYGAMLFWRQEAGCRAEGSAARDGSRSVRPQRHPPIDYDALATAFRDWLKTLSSPMKIKRELPRWAHANGLTYLGSGSQRAVFGVPKGALKIAYNKSGFVANRTEAEVWKDAPADLRQYLVPVVQDSGAGVGEGAWLLMERVICTTHGNMPPETQKRLLDCGINDIVCKNLSDDGRLLDYANVDRKLWAPCATPGTPTSYGALSLREVAPSLIKELSDARRRVEELVLQKETPRRPL